MVNKFIIEYKVSILRTTKRRVKFSTELDREELLGRVDEVEQWITKKLEKHGSTVIKKPIVIRFYPEHEDKRPRTRKGITKLKKLVRA